MKFKDVFLTVMLLGCVTLMDFTDGVPSFLRGPRFTREPPDQVVFLNTSGTKLFCGADGNPPPTVTWVKRDGMPVDDVPGLRHLRPDGSLVFPPFVASNYRQDVHSAVYRCLATNALGTIGSRDVHVRGVVHQDYEAHVYDEFVIRGNTAVMRCHVPSFVKEYHRVMSWTRDDGFVLVYTKRLASKYFVTASGDLLIRNADRTDSFRRYQCHVKNQLTGETKTSSPGQLVLTDPTSSIPPRLTLQRGTVQVLEGETAELVCVAQGYPPPAYSWYRNRNGQLIALDGGSNRIQTHEGTVLMSRVSSEDVGKYVCVVNNSLGTEKIETELSVKANISVFLSPASASVEIGQSVSLNCSVQGYPVQTVTWMKNQRPIVAGNRIHILSRQLYMTSIQRDDQGVYQCMASGDGQSAQAASYLTLSEDAPTLKHVFSRQIIQRGERVSLRCVAVGNPLPRVTWTLDGRPIPESHRIQYGDFVSSVGEVVSFVNITSANSEHGGLYTCVATNEAGVSEHWDRVDIYGPPFIRPMGNLTVVAGEDLVYHCPVGGYPRPNVTWSKEGRRLPFNERQQVFSNGTLMVHNVTREADEGAYLCTAERGELRVQREVKILVLKKPVINPFSIPSNLAAGMRVIITCSVLMGDLPITIRWLKDGLPIKLQSLNLEETPIGDLGSSLIFAGIGRANNGNYTCLAENAAGEASYSDSMVVNVAPSWKLEPRDVSAVVGSNVVLDCQADGYPPPITRWKKSSDKSSPRNFQSVISNYHIQALENGSLIIKNAEIADEGFYLCEAVNGIGFGLSSSMQLSVHVAAHFKSNFIFVRVRKGEELKIKCEAFGDRPLAVRWSKEKVKLDPGLNSRFSFNEELTDEGVISNIIVNSADRRETGLYTCFATNTYGSDEKRIQVVVEEVPDPPSDVRVTEIASRSVTVVWSVPYTGNSPISRYLVQWKKDPDPWKSSFKLETSGTDVKASLRELIPLTKYMVRVSAENSQGSSDFSETLTFMTEAEVPEEPPQHVEATAISSSSIRISWKPPPSHASYGSIIGYYVGYKIQNSPDPFVYKTLDVTGSFTGDCLLSHLRRFTQYSIVVQAFNRKGAGPSSKEISCRTLENDPPQPPPLRVASSSVSSVNLAWNSPSDGDIDPTPVNGYTIYYKHDAAEWEHVNISGDATSYAFQSLTCATHYRFYIVATNAIGRSENSETISLTTQGVAPVAPTKHQLLTVNSTSAQLNLQAWEDGGCPVTFYAVQLKSKGQREWNMVSSSVNPSLDKFVIPGLSPGSWYNLLMSAHNPAGSTEAEFVFSTLTTSGATVSPILLTAEISPSFYRSLPVVVPLVCSGVVLLVIVLVVLVVCLKRNRQRDNNAANPEQENHGNGDGKGDNISMTSVGKKLYEAQREALYYPSPYATTRVSMYSAESESSSGHTSSLHRPADQRNQHIYDVPFPPKQFTYQSRNSGVVHDYQPLHPVSPQHEKTYGDFLFLNEDTTTKPEAKFSEFKPYPMREWTKYNKISNHRMKENNDRMLRDIYGYHESGPVDYESNPEDFEPVGQGANSGEIQEMSEAECDRDYRCDVKQAKDLSSLPFYMVRTPKPKSEYDVYHH